MSSVPDGAPPPPLDAEPPSDPSPARPDAPWGWRRWVQQIQFAILAVGCMAIVAVNLYFIERGPMAATAGAGSGAPATSGAAQTLAHSENDGVGIAAPAPSSEPVIDADAGPAPEADESPPSDTPAPEKPPERDGNMTVEQAAQRTCSTALIDGLSRQIVAEARCLDANAFARVPGRPNLESAGHVFLYLDAPARDHLLRVLDAHPNRVLKVHSALRTVAQQYLLSRWAAGKRCGIQLAMRPGESNHETGLALDISEPGTWRPALESEGFRWLGKIDRVHFNFVGPGATHHHGLDVHAFQRLWNRNHPDDAVAETGRNDAPTEIRLKKSPAGGFPIGARCGGGGRDGRAATGGGSTRAHAR